MNPDIISYYRDRAAEYEKIYDKPERQSDLLLCGQTLQQIFADKNVFEIACGTGYWTQKIAATARNILATDINDAVLEIAKTKNYSPANIGFRKEDLFSLTNADRHESLFGGFIWSHIKLEDLADFTGIIHRLVEPGGTIVLMDNTYREDSSLPVTDKDTAGNTYQTRILKNGTTYKVLKNFPTEEFIREVLTGTATDIQFTQMTYYWILQYKNK
jgi:demethylmenaquinone methyltransferase/2-methoxy-6-polyprenyl-1,4-benzoquinol methylase